MKLSALASLIKDAGCCTLIHAKNDRVFVSNNFGIYSMDGYQKTQNKSELAAMLGIPEKKMNDIHFEETKAEKNVLVGISLDDEPVDEEPVDKLDTRLIVNGDEHMALRHGNGYVGFIRTELLKPVESELTKEYAEICTRKNRIDGTPVYAVKDGMFLRAIIAPAKIGGPTVNDLNEILANLVERGNK